jgi:TRAP-type C4-dicarboxylate transport system permease small subunit
MQKLAELVAQLVIAFVEALIISFVVNLATTAANKASQTFPILQFDAVFGVTFLILVLLTLAGRSYPRI